MDDTIKLVTTFVNATALIMALVLMASILQRADRKSGLNTAIMGLLFSITVVFSMSDPIDLGSAGIFDMRGLLIGAGTALFGPIVGLMTLVTGLLFRGYIGGPGVYAGFVGMVCAYGAGLLWARYVKNLPFATWKKSAILGVMVTAQLLAIFAAPQEIWHMLIVELLPYTLLTNVLGALLINHLISGEVSFLSEAETLKVEANTDHLTGLLNRRGLEMVVPKLKSEFGPSKGRALLYFDVDNFKAANDSYGHAVGDGVLKRVVDRVSENLRRNDVFARMGGDEFAVILPDVDVREAQLIAERCREIVADEGFSNGTEPLPVTISVGAVWLHEPSALGAMLQAADDALYQAKANGRNAVVFVSNIVLPKTGPNIGPLAEAI